jgi:O-antigen ligase
MQSATGTVMPERGMRLLLALLIVLIVVTDILDLGLSMGPGLSVKNAMLYVIAVALVFKMIVQQNFVFDLRALHTCFALLIGYSLLSLFTAYFVVEYPRYSLIESGISLKSRLIDHAIFFLVFFYGLRGSRTAHSLLKVLLLAVVIGNGVALLNALGVISIGDMEQRRDGRMTGVMGESNQDAAFVSLFIPALAGAMMAGRGLWRLLWLAGLIFSVGVIVLTASRGAFVGIFVSAMCGVLLFRRYFPVGRMLAAAGGAAVIAVLVFAVMSIEYGDLLYKRIVGDSVSSDMVGASSGRIEIWSTALAAMAKNPLTFLTGFGWNVYWSMPFRLSPHNHYLSLWFNVGLVGLVCGTAILVLAGREAFKALPYAEREYHWVLISFVIGTIAISVATFFVDLYTPWLWYWAYAGLVLRIAVNARAQRAQQVQQPMRTSVPSPARDPFGWVRTARQ